MRVYAGMLRLKLDPLEEQQELVTTEHLSSPVHYVFTFIITSYDRPDTYFLVYKIAFIYLGVCLYTPRYAYMWVSEDN